MAVFCGSSPGRDPRYAADARAVGAAIADHGFDLVYGGGSAGCMGELARGALGGGATVHGVLPAGLFPDGVTASPWYDGLPGRFVAEEAPDMHARKARFHQLADGYLVLPGGVGTLEEAAEVATWGQIGLHEAPIGFLDTGGFFAPLFDWFATAVHAGFLADGVVDGWVREDDPDRLVGRVAAHHPAPSGPKWLAGPE